MSEDVQTTVSPKKARRPKGLLPIHSGEKCLDVVYAIRDTNAGKPLSKVVLAQALHVSPSSSGYETLLASSVQFGLIQYSRANSQVGLTPLGNSIAYHKGDDEKIKNIREAIFRISLFRQVLTRFRNNRLPEGDLFRNVLIREFSIPPEFAADFELSVRRAAAWGKMLNDTRGGTFVVFDSPISTSLDDTPSLLPENTGEEAVLSINERREEIAIPEPAKSGIPLVGTQISPLAPATNSAIRKTQVFIAHSKNNAILGQIKGLFEATGVDYEIAEEGETTAVPVPKKVADAMRRCNAALINVSADPQEKTKEGDSRVNQNVLIEIGAAFVMYGDRVVLLWDTRVPVPSNLVGLYRCQYEGDALSLEDGIKLIAALKSREGEKG